MLFRAHRHGKLDAFITVAGEQALADARAMEAEQAQGKWRGPLHGIPIALKDNIDTAGVRTTAASEIFKDRVPTEDAEVVRRLNGPWKFQIGDNPQWADPGFEDSGDTLFRLEQR
jgi:aspartyl-tRNA(Asn)/glutamyl-tRNA(Gln) amidotransferase subunit A